MFTCSMYVCVVISAGKEKVKKDVELSHLVKEGLKTRSVISTDIERRNISS